MSCCRQSLLFILKVEAICLWLSAGQLLVDHLFESLIRLGANQSLAIDDEGRRALYSQGLRQGGLLLNEIGVFTGVKAFVESLGIQG